MIYVVTGGAGFIGSNIVAEIERRRLGPIIVVDNLSNGSKWLNLAKRTSLQAIVPTHGLMDCLKACPDDTALIHMGARSSTMDDNAEELAQTNSMLTAALFRLAAERDWPFVYASSASVYGINKHQSDADDSALRPLNQYGWSKALADRMVLAQAATDLTPPVWAGLRFFNVYGPGEDHKGGDRSFVTRCFDAIRGRDSIQLFRGSENFRRDWVSVEDCARLAVDIVTGKTRIGGVFNVGSGYAESFVDVASACILAAEKPAPVSTGPFPEELVGRYQAYTRADITKITAALPFVEFCGLKEGVARYWRSFASCDGMDRHP